MGSSSGSAGSQVFLMHQTISIVTTAVAIPTGIRIPLVVFWKLNIDRATKNPHALFQRISPMQKGQIYGHE
jgi:hypothetical protein